jgi:hypothetical protein
MKVLHKFLIAMAVLMLIAIIAAAVLLRPGGRLANTELGHVLVLFVRMDRFEVPATDGLDSSQVDVFWIGSVADGKGEQRIRIVRAGKVDESFPREYGENDFVIYYKGTQVLQRQRQFKGAWWNYHTYQFRVSKGPNGNPAGAISCVGRDQYFQPVADR